MAANYTEWNLLLLREYFSPAVAGEEVWIQTNREELDAFGFHLGGTEGLLDAVREGPPGISKNHFGIANQAETLARQRRAPDIRESTYQDPGSDIESYKDTNAPPYLPTIAFWVLAATEDTTSQGFYATASELARVKFNNNSLKNTMKFLFQDLEKWSVEQTESRFGAFYSRPLGGYPFVGLAKSQALIAGKDRLGILKLFKQCGLSPGQELRPKTFNSLIEAAAEAHFLSKGLRQAAQQFEIYGPILEGMFGSRLAEWDGRLPSAQRHDNQQTKLNRDVEKGLDLGDEISLIIRPAFDIDWEIGWRMQSSIEASNYKIEFSGSSYIGYPDETNSYLSFIDSESAAQLAARSLLVEALDHDIAASLFYRKFGDENGEGQRSSFFASKDTRVLVWDNSNARNGPELIERELPTAGSAYLLLSNSANLNFLSNEGVDFEEIKEVEGLPKDWILLFISSLEDMPPDKKRTIQLLAGQSESISKARIKFLGGCPILRGGSKQYAYYDLPMIELDAPAGTELSAKGLELNELLSQSTSSKPDNSNIRRFKIERCNSDRHQFQISALHSQELLVTTKLKIALSAGAATGLDKTFSIDRFGESQRKDSGIRGLRIGNNVGNEYESPDSEFFQAELFSDSSQGKENVFRENLACRFLDMVAQKGSIEFGPARKLIARMAEGIKDAQVHPTFLLLELRSRGHIEIETDQKGHLLRVHKTPPTLFSLPIVNNSSCQWYGVCGSLRLEHWHQLCSQQVMDGYLEPCTIDRVPTLRMSVPDLSKLQKFTMNSEFELAKLPVYPVTNWAGTIDEVRTKLQQNKGYENFQVNNLERLNPLSVRFTYENALFMKVDTHRQYELFRIDDPVIQGSQVYMLGTSATDGVDFNYIQDSRWAIWLASSAFFKMLSKMGFPEAYPWPLPYSEIDGSIWLPARLKPPLVIERALCLCSGSGPKPVAVKNKPHETQEFMQLLDTKNEAIVINKLTNMYTDMANGIWLHYQWVPKSIAEKIAVSLGCKLERI